VLARLPADAEVTDYPGKLLLPAFVHCHVPD
jgi:imidazolonepropionase-like amidohydrolase